MGAGGREHALAWKLAQSDAVETVLVVPGNAGTALGNDTICNVEGVSPDDFSDLLSCARKYNISFVIPTQESHFAAGIHDFFSQST
jgi:phosphoribosylamine-glycine ligase